MSLFVSSGFNGVTDPDAASYIAAVEAADGQLLEFATAKAINDFVVGCKTDRIWDAIKASCILAGARTLAGALVPLKGTAPTNFNFVSSDYNRKTGLKGDGSSKYLDSNRKNNADPQNSQHLSVYANTATTATSSTGVYPVYIGAGRNSSGASQFARDGNLGLYARSRNATARFSLAGGSVGLLGINRSSEASYAFRAGGTTNQTPLASQAPYNGNLFVYKDNFPTPQDTYINGRLAFYSIGEALDLALLDARVTTLINAFGSIPS